MNVSVIGGGQLGRMLGLAGIPMGMRFRFLEPNADCPAAAVGPVIAAVYDDERALATLARDAAVITFEFENVPVAALERIDPDARPGPPGVPLRPVLYPRTQSLAVSQDRVDEKRFLASRGVPVQPFEAVHDEASLRRAVESVGTPAMLKTRRLGYDGKGQQPVRRPEEALRAWEALHRAPCIYEAFVPFVREVSMLVVRGIDGAMRTWPLVENEHRNGILAVSRTPATDAASLEADAAHHARAVAEGLGHVGVLALEFFVVDNQGRPGLVGNEIAPRVHNSGHWTIEGAVTSQFTNHLRAIAGWPLGDTGARGASVMVNLVGEAPPINAMLELEGASVHLYGKTPRPGRKIGHVTITGPTSASISEASSTLLALVERHRVHAMAFANC